MKKYLFGLFLIPTLCFGQKYALIDKKMKQPIIYTDSVTVEQVKAGYFPVRDVNVDTLIANLMFLRNMVSKRQRAKMQSFELRAANSAITTERVPYAYGDRYLSVAKSFNGDIVASMRLISSDQNNKTNMQFLDKMLKYLRSNKSFWKEPNEITPKLYNVIVITE